MLLIATLGFVWLYLDNLRMLIYAQIFPHLNSYHDLAFVTNILFGLMVWKCQQYAGCAES